MISIMSTLLLAFYVLTLSIVSVVSVFRYKGCYKGTSDRDLPVVKHTTDANIQYCSHYCTGLKYKFFGLQNGEYCTCGNSYGRHGEASEEECNKWCVNSQICGGEWRNSIFITGVELNTDNLKPLGCYKDTSDRDLPVLTQNDYASKEICNNYCREQNYKYFGLQNGKYCTCGDDYGKHEEAPMSECNMVCKGHWREMCGGALRNLIFRVVFDKQKSTYIGCYRDTDDRDLPVVKHTTDANFQYCSDYCTGLKYKYFGLQNGDYCTCGNSYGEYGKASETECNKPCVKTQSQICGGEWRNSIYITGVELNTVNLDYIGCYKDSEDRDLELFTYNDYASTETCNNYCKEQNYEYFGLQYGKYCTCGDSYGKHGEASIFECNMKCKGSRHELCGGAWRNLIFKVAYEEQKYKYIGCYKDTSDRDLPIVKHTTDANIQYCSLYCTGLKYKYFGLQNGEYCTCGNSYGRHGKASQTWRHGVLSESECNKPCVKTQSQICGGEGRNSIYTTGVELITDNLKPIGCYKDTSDRDLPLVTQNDYASKEICNEYCNKMKYKLFGLQNGTYCTCGDNFPPLHREREMSECNIVCKGNWQEMCGGAWRNLIFRVEEVEQH